MRRTPLSQLIPAMRGPQMTWDAKPDSARTAVAEDGRDALTAKRSQTIAGGHGGERSDPPLPPVRPTTLTRPRSGRTQPRRSAHCKQVETILMCLIGATVRPLRGRRVGAGESAGRAAARCARRARPTAITSTAPRSQRMAECADTACAAETAVSRETPLPALDSSSCGLRVSVCPVSANQ